MDAEDPLADNCCNRKLIECITYGFPLSETNSSFTLIIKAIEFIEFTRLMIAAEHEEVVGVFDLIGHHQTDAFE